MRAFKVFIFGLLYGWFIKVAFDRIYRENELEVIRNENASLKDYIRTLEDRLTPMAQATESAPRSTTIPQSVQAPAPDDLKVIKGIGPAIEKKLNSAGIYTFEALARLSVEDLEKILGNARRLAKEGSLIEQAAALAQKR